MGVKRDRHGWICPRCGFKNNMRDNACNRYDEESAKYCGMRKPAHIRYWHSYRLTPRQRNINKDRFQDGKRRWHRVLKALARSMQLA